MPTTQDNRLLAIYTPLGKDFLLVNRITASEALSELFSIDVELLHEEEKAGFEATVVDPRQIIGKAVTLTIDQRDGTIRELTGIVQRFSQGNRDTRFSYYYARVVPHVWILTQKSQSRIFQNLSVPDILRKVFDGFEVSWQIQGVTNRRNYCVQYRETDFDFASRLMEEEGIYYYFEHKDGKHRMVVANTSQSHPDCPSKSKIPYFLDVTRQTEDFVTSINSWRTDFQLQTGKVTFWDYNFQLPAKKLDKEELSVFSVSDNQKLEMYDFPAGYGRKYDAEFALAETDKTTAAKIMIESLDAQYKVISGAGDCSALTAGFRFELFNHPNVGFNGQHTILSVAHEAEQNPSYVSNDTVEEAYRNSFTCIAHGNNSPPFRPVRKTPKPVVQGSQTAFVVGPAGEEIFTDKFGRVKIQLHWDRDGQVNEASSCWVRVAQTWAGNKWGTMFIPRIGMEVLVHFLEGDPDQPIITGTVYNPQTMPPYTLPDEKTKSTIKSNSSKGGGGFNEFRFEDKKGSEQIFIHAEKNQDIRVKNDVMETILHDRHLIIENDQYEKVKKDKHLQVLGDHNEKITGTMSLTVTSDLQEKVSNNYALDAGSVHIKAGMTTVIEAGTALTLKVGGSSININSGGIQIVGSPMLMLNSGGSPTPGAGSSPEAPKDPKEADKAEPGAKTGQKPPSPPVAPVNIGPLAATMKSAAKSGTPFCCNCQGK